MLRTNRYRATEVKEEPVAVTNNKELLKAIGYIRVSTEGQTGDDTQEQRPCGRIYAASKKSPCDPRKGS